MAKHPSRKAMLKRLGMAACFGNERVISAGLARAKSSKIDARKALALLSATDRLRLTRWLLIADTWEIELPPPHIAAILVRLRKKLNIKPESEGGDNVSTL